MRAGIFQCAGGGLSPLERLDRLRSALHGQALDLVVCAELFMSGYDVGEEVATLAESCKGTFVNEVAAVAQETGCAIVYGYPERDGEQLYNAAACVAADGRLLANHRKLVLPPGFEDSYFTPGEGLTLFDFGGLRCAILICYDAEHPEAVRAAAEAGAEVVIVPTALVEQWSVVAFQVMPARAFENGVWLLYANHAGVENGSRYLGGSCILAPDGRDAARCDGEEALIIASLDRERVVTAQCRLPYLKDVQALRRRLSASPFRSDSGSVV